MHCVINCTDGAPGKQSSSWRARWTGTVIRKSRAPRRKVDVIIATWCIEIGSPLLHNDRDFNVMERELGLLSALSAD